MTRLNADSLVTEIDAGAQFGGSNAVAGSLCARAAPKDEVWNKAVGAVRDDLLTAGHREHLINQFRNTFLAMPNGKQGPWRLAWLMLREAQDIDWELAEYLILWSREMGLSDDQIIDAFRENQLSQA
ncbi:hypothetical protein K3172_14865 [Qipengyuania sp. 6B39]|uniref:hypothetical protein n=1 Tax=Qipengyuania proteolytica TaxID=2867239 RepID=UPI001C8B052D|nr:hypothetical protein [Qipengyuania proteolytica]MBX7497138.1 hypothetical protein [Qipengyuania proteolytica]